MQKRLLLALCLVLSLASVGVISQTVRFRLPSVAGDPGTVANGDLWYNSSTGHIRGRSNGSTVSLDTSPSLPVSVTNGGTGAAPGGDDQVLVSSSSSAASWKTLTDCSGSNEAVTYDASSNSWGCASITGGGGGGVGTVTNTGTLTSGKAIIGNGSTDVTVSSATGVAHLSSGTLSGSNVNLASEVTGVLPGANGGGLVLLESHTASASSSLDFTSCLSSSYDTYHIVGNAIVMTSTGAELWLRFNTGSGFDTGSNYKYFDNICTTSPFCTNGTSSSATRISVSVGLDPFGFSGDLYHVNNALVKFFKYDGAGKNNGDGGYYYLQGFGVYTTTTTDTQLQFLPSTSTIASGSIRCYGVAK